MKRFLAVLLMLSFGLFMENAWSDGTGHPYYPMDSGTSITYDVYAIKGTWHGSGMQLDVDSRTYLNTQSNSYSNGPGTGAGNCPYFTGPLYMAFRRDVVSGVPTPSNSVPITATDWSHTLRDGGWTVQSNGITVNYIGEGVNEQGQVMIPFEPKLSWTPYVGEEARGTSTVYSDCSATSIQDSGFNWRYRTVAYYANWYFGFNDVWRTGLNEYKSKRVYNYIFMRGKGMVHFWYGTLTPNDPGNPDSDGSVEGYELIGVSY